MLALSFLDIQQVGPALPQRNGITHIIPTALCFAQLTEVQDHLPTTLSNCLTFTATNLLVLKTHFTALQTENKNGDQCGVLGAGIDVT